MKIAIDARLYGMENAGLGRYVINLISNLEAVDEKNDYFVLLRKKYFESLTFPPKWKKVLADFRHYSFREQKELPKILENIRPNLVHFPHFNAPFFYKGKFVVTIHDILMHKQKGLEATTLNPFLYYVKRLAYKTVFRHAVAKSVKVIVPSKSVKKEVVDYYKIPSSKVIVTYEGFDEKISVGDKNKVLSKFKLTPPYFLYAGNAYPHKNLSRLIEAVLAVNRGREEKISLAIASSRNVFTDRLEKLIKKLDAEGVVKLLGFVSDGELGTLYANSLAFAFPSLSEGFGLPGLEAMSAGTLLLASDIPVLREIYKKSAIYFNPYDFTSIARVMEEAIDMEPVRRKELIEKAGEFAKRYSWDKMARQTLKVYEDSYRLRQGK